MATTSSQRCKTCQRTMIKMPGSIYELCPVRHTVSLFNQKIKGRVLFRVGQFINAANRQYHDDIQKQNPNTSAPQLSQKQFPLVHGKKKAVLCGVSYNSSKRKLEASVHNVRSMQELLVNKLGFSNASILILTEEESDHSRIPTKRNIQAALQWLIQGCQSGDSLVFYYSGHASQIPNEHGDDKALCPVDYRVAGTIINDEINASIVAPLTHGVTLHSVIDTCFSGTLLDLPFLCKINKEGLYRWEEHQITDKGTRGGKVVCISACADNQNAADTWAFTSAAMGALTFSFIKAIETESKPTYGRLLTSMRKKVNQAQQVAGLSAPFASPMSQEPQLSSASRFEIYSEHVVL